MPISSDAPFAREAAVASTSNTASESSVPAINTSQEEKSTSLHAPNPTSSKTSSETAFSSPSRASTVDPTFEFSGEVNTNNDIPSQEVLKRVENFTVLDKDGKSVPFKSLYSGPNVARRVLVIFIRHFFCGNCQEYIRTLHDSITPSSLLSLPTPTFICIIGCGSPSLIPMYASTTNCPFPIYADPTKRLYSELGMLRTLNLGHRPEYQRRALVQMVVKSFVQSVRELKGGKIWKGGDYQQVGGEFLFEPLDMNTPIQSPDGEEQRRVGDEKINGYLGHGIGEEEKRITWCHRMRNTRDHAETPELREVLGLDGEGIPGKSKKRWSRAILERKGTGLNGRQSVSLNRKMDRENGLRESGEQMR